MNDTWISAHEPVRVKFPVAREDTQPGAEAQLITALLLVLTLSDACPNNGDLLSKFKAMDGHWILESVWGTFELQFKSANSRSSSSLRQIALGARGNWQVFGYAIIKHLDVTLILYAGLNVMYVVSSVRFSVVPWGHGTDSPGPDLGQAGLCESVSCRNYHTLKNLFHQDRPMPCELFKNASVSLS